MTFFTVCIRPGGAFTQIFMTLDALSMKCLHLFSWRMTAFTIRFTRGYVVILMAADALHVKGLYAARLIVINNTGFMAVAARLGFAAIFFIIIMMTVITGETIIVAVAFMVKIPVIPQSRNKFTVWPMTRFAGNRGISFTFYIGMVAILAG